MHTTNMRLIGIFLDQTTRSLIATGERLNYSSPEDSTEPVFL